MDAAASGMRWVAGRGADLLRERIPRMIDDGAEAYGEGVWSWHPRLVSSLWKVFVRLNRAEQAVNPKATVAIELILPGRARHINRKPTAWGMPDDPVPRATSCAYGRFLAHEPRVPLGIAAFPAPSVSRGRDVLAKARAPRAAGRSGASGAHDK